MKSLALRTDLIFAEFDGEIVDRRSYFVIRTFSNPNYFYGNLILFPSAPALGDVVKWREIFAREFTDPRIYHETFVWDSSLGERGDTSEFEAAGFVFEENIVLVGSSVRAPSRLNPSVSVRPLLSDRDWEASTELHIRSSSESRLDISFADWKSFISQQSISGRVIYQRTTNAFTKMRRIRRDRLIPSQQSIVK